MRSLSNEKLDMILYGTKGEQVTIHYHNKDGRSGSWKMAFEGVIGNLQRRYTETSSEYMRERISELMSERICPTCGGVRLRKEALAVTIEGENIIQVTEWPVLQTLEWVRRLASPETPLTPRQQAIAEQILKEILARLGFLVDVGLDYLTSAALGLHALRRRSPAHPPGNPDRLALDGCALCAGRAIDWTAPAR